jgi:hypothetical protein
VGALAAPTSTSTTLQVTLTNGFSSSIAIQEVDLTWNSSGGDHLLSLQLIPTASGTATTFWSGNVQNPQAISVFSTTPPAIPSGATATLILNFNKTGTTGSTLTVITDKSCQVQASN